MSRIYNIIINKHTKVRRPMSCYLLDISIGLGNVGATAPLVTDITRVAKGTYKVNYEIEEFSREALDELGDMLEEAGLKFDDNLGTEPKTPSWWERLRGKR